MSSPSAAGVTGTYTSRTDSFGFFFFWKKNKLLYYPAKPAPGMAEAEGELYILWFYSFNEK